MTKRGRASLVTQLGEKGAGKERGDFFWYDLMGYTPRLGIGGLSFGSVPCLLLILLYSIPGFFGVCFSRFFMEWSCD